MFLIIIHEYRLCKRLKKLTIDETSKPRVKDPDHRGKNDACKIGRRADAISVCVVVQ